RTIKSKWATFNLKVEPEALTKADLSFTMTTRADKVRVEPAEFDDFRTFQAETSRAYRVWLTMKPIQDLGDAPLVEGLLHWMPEDADSAAILARVYADNGKKADARRVLKRSLAYSPKSKPLLEMAVTLAENEAEEVAVQTKLVELFP